MTLSSPRISSVPLAGPCLLWGRGGVRDLVRAAGGMLAVALTVCSLRAQVPTRPDSLTIPSDPQPTAPAPSPSEVGTPRSDLPGTTRLPSDPTPARLAPGDIPPAGALPPGGATTTTPSAGLPAAGRPAANAPSAGLPAAGAPAAGTPAAGLPAAGRPASGAPAAGLPAAGAPAGGSPAVGSPSTGSPSTAPVTPAVPSPGAPSAAGGGTPSTGVAPAGGNVPFVGAPPAGAPTVVLRLEQVMDWVMAEHPLANAADAVEARGPAALLAARGAFDPTVQGDFERKEYLGTEYFQYADAGLSWQSPYGFKIEGGRQWAEGAFVSGDRTVPEAGQGYLAVKIPLLQGLMTDKYRIGVQQGRLAVDLNRAAAEVIRNELRYDVAVAYAFWAYATRVLEISAETEALINQRLRDTRELYLQGDRPAVDTLEATIALANQFLTTQQALVDVTVSAQNLRALYWVLPEGAAMDLVDLRPRLPVDTALVSRHPQLAELRSLVAQQEARPPPLPRVHQAPPRRRVQPPRGRVRLHAGGQGRQPGAVPHERVQSRSHVSVPDL